MNVQEHGVKLGTPVQSIDSAVESLEDSPVQAGDAQRPSKSADKAATDGSKYGK
jgi:hypothetical protein